MNTTFSKLSMKTLSKFIRSVRRQMRHVEVKGSCPSITYIITGIKVCCHTYDEGKVFSLHPISEALSTPMSLFMDDENIVRMTPTDTPTGSDLPKNSLIFDVSI